MLMMLLVCARNSRANNFILTNGNFASEGASYGSGLFATTGWTNESGLNIQASIAPSGFEDTSSDDGSNYLRLVSDTANSQDIGFIVQDLGTMVAGDTYTFTGDDLGGLGVLPWGATVELTSDGGLVPSTVYSSQILSGVGQGVVNVGALDISYTATSADNGNPLFLWLRAAPSGAGQDIRGGLADIQLTITTASTPEPGSVVLVSIGLIALGLLRRRQRMGAHGVY